MVEELDPALLSNENLSSLSQSQADTGSGTRVGGRQVVQELDIRLPEKGNQNEAGPPSQLVNK